VVLVETRQLRATTKALPVKTDRNDARAMAQVVHTGWYKAVQVKSELSQGWWPEAVNRALLSGRKLLVAKLRDLDNGIRGLLRGFGLKVGQVSEAAFPTRVRELTDAHAGLEALMGTLLQARDAVRTERERLHRLVLAAVREDDVCRRLMTVPGVGPVTALTFCSAVDDPARFSRSRAVGAHFGLTPRRYQSGETDRMGHISKQGDSLARQALYEAANVPLTRTGKWSALKAWGLAVAKRAGMRRAKVAVARKLAVVLHRMWRDGTEFCWSREVAAA
jgi:transposase